jgi:hypothetical protein
VDAIRAPLITWLLDRRRGPSTQDTPCNQKYVSPTCNPSKTRPMSSISAWQEVPTNCLKQIIVDRLTRLSAKCTNWPKRVLKCEGQRPRFYLPGIGFPATLKSQIETLCTRYSWNRSSQGGNVTRPCYESVRMLAASSNRANQWLLSYWYAYTTNLNPPPSIVETQKHGIPSAHRS